MIIFQYTEELGDDGLPIKRFDLNQDEEIKYQTLVCNVKQDQAFKKMHKLFKELVEQPHDESLLVLSNMEMSEVRWGILLKEYPEVRSLIEEHLHEFESESKFDFICLINNLMSVNFQVSVLYMHVNWLAEC